MLLKTFIACAILAYSAAQYYNIPIQISIPGYNASRWNHTNSSNPWRPGYGWHPQQNYTNSTNFNRTTPAGNLFLGTIGPQDRLLLSEKFIKYGFPGFTRTETLEYPKDRPGNYRGERISAIQIINLREDGKLTSKVKIISGGIGYKYVKIGFVTRSGKGMRYSVRIFGH